MYVVTVQFQLLPGAIEDFRREVLANASASLHGEEGCRQFDVCFSPEAPGSIFLYEVYDSKAAFEAHLLSDHFKRFNELTSPWVRSRHAAFFERLHSRGEAAGEQESQSS